MESSSNFFDEEWHSLDKMFSSDQIGLNFNIPLPVSDDSSNVNLFVADDEHLVNVSDNINYHFFSQENSISSSDASNGTISLSYPNNESFPFCTSNIVPPLSHNICDQSVQFCMMNEITNSSPTGHFLSEGSLYLTQDIAPENPLVSSKEKPLKRKLETPKLPDAVDDEGDSEKIDKNNKKRIRVPRDNKNNDAQSKKNHKMNDIEEGSKNNNGAMNGQSLSSCSSNDDLRASNSDGKPRASRGNAIDPQSLYARKRREKINERLRILQNLVPNGTKVDISTMLEEAIEYVKFLKLQIQLLSSDDMWMYAPIAYNGMDMGLYQNITSSLPN